MSIVGVIGSIDPRRLRKAQKPVEESSVPLDEVVFAYLKGARVRTDYGCIIQGTEGKYETFTMVILHSGATPAWRHPKKQRTLRCAAGAVTVLTEVDGVREQITLLPGHEYVVSPGVTHRLTCNGAHSVVYVTQEGKYAAHLEEVEPAVVVDVDDAVLASYEPDLHAQAHRPGKRAPVGMILHQAMLTQNAEASTAPVTIARMADMLSLDNIGRDFKFSEEGSG